MGDYHPECDPTDIPTYTGNGKQPQKRTHTKGKVTVTLERAVRAVSSNSSLL